MSKREKAMHMGGMGVVVPTEGREGERSGSRASKQVPRLATWIPIPLHEAWSTSTNTVAVPSSRVRHVVVSVPHITFARSGMIVPSGHAASLGVRARGSPPPAVPSAPPSLRLPSGGG